jgi:hypothetical protein
MTPSPLTCQPKLSKGFKQLPFLDTPTPSMTLTNSSCNFTVSGIEFGTSRQHPTYTGSSRMRTKHLLPASSPHGCGISWRLWSCPSCQACSLQATRCVEAVHLPLTPLTCPCQELWRGACELTCGRPSATSTFRSCRLPQHGVSSANSSRNRVG